MRGGWPWNPSIVSVRTARPAWGSRAGRALAAFRRVAMGADSVRACSLAAERE